MIAVLLGPFVQRFIQPPVRPDIELPWIARGYAGKINAVLDQSWALCHLDGLEKGFILGVAVATLVFLLCRPNGGVNASKIIG
jgi:hypothetical protein